MRGAAKTAKQTHPQPTDNFAIIAQAYLMMQHAKCGSNFTF